MTLVFAPIKFPTNTLSFACFRPAMVILLLFLRYLASKVCFLLLDVYLAQSSVGILPHFRVECCNSIIDTQFLGHRESARSVELFDQTQGI